MEVFKYFLQSFVLIVLYVLDGALLVRAILSWIDPEREMRFSVFLHMITEPVIHPIRVLCYKMNWFQQTPLDFPFLLTVILIMLLQMLVRVL